jgi:hypothetical protein
MRKFTKMYLGVLTITSMVVFGSCKDDSYLVVPKPIPDQSFTEEFDTIQKAFERGWKPINRSVPIGSGVWSQGVATAFPAYSSNATNNGYAVVDFNSSGIIASGVTTPALINNWLVSKPLMIKNGDKIVFYTRTSQQTAPDEYADRLEVRVNPYNSTDNVGRGDGNQVGDFTLPLLIINSNLAVNGPNSYPRDWTKYTATVLGVPEPTMGRFAFRYYMPNAGPAATNVNGNVIGLDSVAYISAK